MRLAVPELCDGWIRLGCFGRPQGLKGEIWFTADNPDSSTLAPGLTLRIEDGEGAEREVRVTDVRRARGRFVLRLSGVDDRTAAEALNRCVAEVRRTDFPEPEDCEFYHIDLIGLAVHGPRGERLGRVDRVIETPAHDVLVIRDGDRELLVPLVSAWVGRVDIEAGRVELVLVEEDADR